MDSMPLRDQFQFTKVYDISQTVGCMKNLVRHDRVTQCKAKAGKHSTLFLTHPL